MFAFLDLVSFAIFATQHMWPEVVVFFTQGIVEMVFGYVILSYFKFITQVRL